MSDPENSPETVDDLVCEAELEHHQWIPPDYPPADERDGVPYWHPEDIKQLHTRKAWKRLGRRVIRDSEPIRMSEGDHPIALFAESQTLTEEAYQEQFRDENAARCSQWNGRWAELLEELQSWLTRLPAERPEELEFDLLELLRRRNELVDQHGSLELSARKQELELHAPERTPWIEALTHYRAHRQETALADLEERHEDIATPILEDLLQREGKSGDPFHLQAYWEFYGKFHKRYESALYEKEISQATRIKEFHNLFPARERERHFTLYLGPTNSGKTYRALQRLKEAERGVYLAPLRLLALEVADTLNEWGVPCSMVTGEERMLVEGAEHISSTIEMLSTHRLYDVAVIDEAQMLGDADRGWAWTQAILGVRAKEVCIIAAPQARPAIEKLLQLTGDPWDVVETDRLTPLKTLSRPIEKLEELEPGTALIAFSRTAVLRLKAEVEHATGQKCAALYGALPPEVRRMQATLFNSGEAPYLVATDAIGMGLNLPIRTVLFSQDRKMINRTEHMLTPMEVRQIAGRAGRFGKNEVGFVGTYRIGTGHVRQALKAEPFTTRRAHLAPNLDHLQAIASLHEDRKVRLARLFTLFIKAVKPDPEIYKLADLEDQTTLARLADRYHNLDLATRFMLSAAPVPLRATAVVSSFERMVIAVAKETPLPLEEALPLPPHRHDPNRLIKLEDAVKVVNLYCWLHFREEALFPDLLAAETLRGHLNQEINTLLAKQRRPKEKGQCTKCHAPLPEHWRGKLCRRCEPPRKGGGRGGKGGGRGGYKSGNKGSRSSKQSRHQ
uniref:RNA helicase n=1 Tax=Magnetococcus massalia (strain MO-1) TaxID=451514 RepID=A0A1S7LCU8_MAGMO|nr:conserved protein of unknown function [Include DNA/RNA helicase, C-terminal domain and DNA repair protein Rad4 DNA-binding domain] [Candidatus Magnetococcus massalia]